MPGDYPRIDENRMPQGTPAGGRWWETAVVYQIYPRSFADSNGDGVGDLQGVIDRLDHIAWLGVDAIWLSPIYPSPMADFGYDVADYCDIDPVFGTLDDFDRLVAACHKRGLRVLLDWVPNHTSIEHPWFRRSRSSRDDPYRNWYVWRDSRPGGGPPTNWIRMWSTEPAWTYDEATDQWFLHVYFPQQPDLNWHEPAVEHAMHDTLRFWLDRGVDGFRADVVHLIGKGTSDELCDVTGPGADRPLSRQISGPYGHELLRRIRVLLDGYPERPMMVGEVVLYEPGEVVRYYGDDDELHQVFDFRLVKAPWDVDVIRGWLRQAMDELGERSGTVVMGNHDNPRQRTRLGNDARTRAAALLLLFLRGSPYLYAGEELGLPDGEIPRESWLDPAGRDGCRAPIPWEVGPPYYGWPAEPWLPFVADAAALSVEQQRRDPISTLHLYRAAIALRKSRPALATGTQRIIELPSPHVLAWERRKATERFVVAVNFSDEPQEVAVTGRIVLSSRSDSTASTLTGVLQPDEAVVIEVTG